MIEHEIASETITLQARHRDSAAKRALAITRAQYLDAAPRIRCEVAASTEHYEGEFTILVRVLAIRTEIEELIQAAKNVLLLDGLVGRARLQEAVENAEKALQDGRSRAERSTGHAAGSVAG